MTVVPRLSDPPRDIPPGVVLTVLARRDEISDSLWFFIPAAAAIGGATLDLVPGARVALLIVATIFFGLGLSRVLRSLAHSVRMLWSMRYGFLAPGRIVACRFAWDARKAEMPFAPFLSNWSVNLDQARVRKSTGRLFKWMFIGLSLPYVLTSVMLTAFILLGMFFKIDVIEKNFGVATVAAIWASSAALVALIAIPVLVMVRAQAKGEVQKYVEWRRMAHGEQYDANSAELVEALKRSSEPVKLNQKLPPESARLDLICRVDYMARGERATGEGRVPLCDRLDLGGVEPLLFRPSRTGQVLVLAGLPAPVALAARGQWQDLPVGPAVASLAPPILVAGATLAWLVSYLPFVAALLR
jgi:hypothetical protein